MTRRFISAALGLALAASTTFGASAATNPTALVSALSAQPGVSQQLLNAAAAVSGACAAGSGGSACVLALQALVNAVPASLAPSLKAEVTELVSTTVASRPDIAANPALAQDLASLSRGVTDLGGGPLTGSTTPPAGGGNASAGGAG